MTATFRFGRFELSPSTRQLLLDRQAVPLGARAFDVLLALIERRDRVVTKDEMLDLVWRGLVIEENNLQVQISTIRKVLGPNAVATIPGRGYRFTLNLESVPPAESRHAAIPSIAVLPFANVSGDITNEYFADGLSEELLNVLAKIRGLRVASRTSAFYFKGKDVDLPTIAQRLKVAAILQGSVRKAGDRVRIAVQLIRADTDAHLWSETYERDLGDVFALQDDIARAVVTELRTAFVGELPNASRSAQVKVEIAMAAKGRAENVEVHRLYLEGKFFLERQTSEDIAKGIGLLERAVDLDSTYALAWAALSRAYVVRSWADVDNRISSSKFALARAAAERALAIQPDLPDGHAALGWIRMLADWDWSGAKESLERALEVAPEHIDALRYASLLTSNVGHPDEALKLLRRVVALDPLNWHALSNLANYLAAAGVPDEAGTAVEKSMELNPHGAITHFVLGKVRLEQRRLDDALTAFGRMGGPMRLMGVAIAEFARGNQRESDEALSQLIERYADDNAFQIAQACAYRREFDVSFLWLARAYEQHAAELCQVKWDPLLRNLHGDERWHAFLEKMGLPR